MPREYVAHEYMNDDSRPCFQADVAAELADAKLEYVASGEIREFSAADAHRRTARRLGPDRRSRSARVGEGFSACPAACATTSMCGDRGATHAARDAALADLYLTLTRRPEDFIYELNLPAGHGALERSFYEPVVAALGQGPQRIGDLMSLAGRGGRRDNPAELAGMLVAPASHRYGASGGRHRRGGNAPQQSHRNASAARRSFTWRLGELAARQRPALQRRSLRHGFDDAQARR